MRTRLLLLVLLPLLACDSTPDAPPDTTRTTDAEIVDARGEDLPADSDTAVVDTLPSDASAPVDSPPTTPPSRPTS